MTTLTDTPPASLQPPDAAAQKDALAAHLSAVLQIRGYAIGVEQTHLIPIDPNKLPDWWGPLTKTLVTAQTHAGTWTQTLEPAITSKIPQAAITTGNHFDTAANDILGILASGTPPTSAQQQTIVEDLQWISSHLADNHADIVQLQATFTQFQKDTGTDFGAMSTGAASIQHALDVDADLATTLSSDITVQQANIAADGKVITASGIAGGVGIFVGAGLIGLGAAAGPAAPFLIGAGIFLVVGSVVEMAAVIAVYEQKLAAAQNKLNDDQAALTLEKQQALSLTALSKTVGNLVDLNKAMGQSLSEIADWWQGVRDKIDAVITDVQNAQSDEGFWHGLKLDVEAAQTDWADFRSFATNMQTMATGAPNKIVSVAPALAGP
jgi:hypothetical protein